MIEEKCFRCKELLEDDPNPQSCEICSNIFCDDCTADSGYYSDDDDYYCENEKPGIEVERE